MLIDWLSKYTTLVQWLNILVILSCTKTKQKTAGNITDDFLTDEESARVKTSWGRVLVCIILMIDGLKAVGLSFR